MIQLHQIHEHVTLYFSILYLQQREKKIRLSIILECPCSLKPGRISTMLNSLVKLHIFKDEINQGNEDNCIIMLIREACILK